MDTTTSRIVKLNTSDQYVTQYKGAAGQEEENQTYTKSIASTLPKQKNMNTKQSRIVKPNTVGQQATQYTDAAGADGAVAAPGDKKISKIEENKEENQTQTESTASASPIKLRQQISKKELQKQKEYDAQRKQDDAKRKKEEAQLKKEEAQRKKEDKKLEKEKQNQIRKAQKEALKEKIRKNAPKQHISTQLQNILKLLPRDDKQLILDQIGNPQKKIKEQKEQKAQKNLGAQKEKTLEEILKPLSRQNKNYVISQINEAKNNKQLQIEESEQGENTTHKEEQSENTVLEEDQNSWCCKGQPKDQDEDEKNQWDDSEEQLMYVTEKSVLKKPEEPVSEEPVSKNLEESVPEKLEESVLKKPEEPVLEESVLKKSEEPVLEESVLEESVHEEPKKSVRQNQISKKKNKTRGVLYDDQESYLTRVSNKDARKKPEEYTIYDQDGNKLKNNLSSRQFRIFYTDNLTNVDQGVKIKALYVINQQIADSVEIYAAVAQIFRKIIGRFQFQNDCAYFIINSRREKTDNKRTELTTDYSFNLQKTPDEEYDEKEQSELAQYKDRDYVSKKKAIIQGILDDTPSKFFVALRDLDVLIKEHIEHTKEVRQQAKQNKKNKPKKTGLELQLELQNEKDAKKQKIDKIEQRRIKKLQQKMEDAAAAAAIQLWEQMDEELIAKQKANQNEDVDYNEDVDQNEDVVIPQTDDTPFIKVISLAEKILNKPPKEPENTIVEVIYEYENPKYEKQKKGPSKKRTVRRNEHLKRGCAALLEQDLQPVSVVSEQKKKEVVAKPVVVVWEDPYDKETDIEKLKQELIKQQSKLQEKGQTKIFNINRKITYLEKNIKKLDFIKNAEEQKKDWEAPVIPQRSENGDVVIPVLSTVDRDIQEDLKRKELRTIKEQITDIPNMFQRGEYEKIRNYSKYISLECRLQILFDLCLAEKFEYTETARIALGLMYEKEILYFVNGTIHKKTEVINIIGQKRDNITKKLRKEQKEKNEQESLKFAIDIKNQKEESQKFSDVAKEQTKPLFRESFYGARALMRCCCKKPCISISLGIVCPSLLDGGCTYCHCTQMLAAYHLGIKIYWNNANSDPSNPLIRSFAKDSTFNHDNAIKNYFFGAQMHDPQQSMDIIKQIMENRGDQVKQAKLQAMENNIQFNTVQVPKKNYAAKYYNGGLTYQSVLSYNIWNNIVNEYTQWLLAQKKAQQDLLLKQKNAKDDAAQNSEQSKEQNLELAVQKPKKPAQELYVFLQPQQIIEWKQKNSDEIKEHLDGINKKKKQEKAIEEEKKNRKEQEKEEQLQNEQKNKKKPRVRKAKWLKNQEKLDLEKKQQELNEQQDLEKKQKEQELEKKQKEEEIKNKATQQQNIKQGWKQNQNLQNQQFFKNEQPAIQRNEPLKKNLKSSYTKNTFSLLFSESDDYDDHQEQLKLQQENARKEQEKLQQQAEEEQAKKEQQAKEEQAKKEQQAKEEQAKKEQQAKEQKEEQARKQQQSIKEQEAKKKLQQQQAEEQKKLQQQEAKKKLQQQQAEDQKAKEQQARQAQEQADKKNLEARLKELEDKLIISEQQRSKAQKELQQLLAVQQNTIKEQPQELQEEEEEKSQADKKREAWQQAQMNRQQTHTPSYRIQKTYDVERPIQPILNKPTHTNNRTLQVLSNQREHLADIYYPGFYEKDQELEIQDSESQSQIQQDYVQQDFQSQLSTQQYELQSQQPTYQALKSQQSTYQNGQQPIQHQELKCPKYDIQSQQPTEQEPKSQQTIQQLYELKTRELIPYLKGPVYDEWVKSCPQIYYGPKYFDYEEEVYPYVRTPAHPAPIQKQHVPTQKTFALPQPQQQQTSYYPAPIQQAPIQQAPIQQQGILPKSKLVLSSQYYQQTGQRASNYQEYALPEPQQQQTNHYPAPIQQQGILPKPKLVLSQQYYQQTGQYCALNQQDYALPEPQQQTSHYNAPIQQQGILPKPKLVLSQQYYQQTGQYNASNQHQYAPNKHQYAPNMQHNVLAEETFDLSDQYYQPKQRRAPNQQRQSKKKF